MKKFVKVSTLRSKGFSIGWCTGNRTIIEHRTNPFTVNGKKANWIGSSYSCFVQGHYTDSKMEFPFEVKLVVDSSL